MSAGSLLARSSLLRFTALGAALLTSVVASRVLGPDGRGYYQLVLTLAALAASIGGLSVEHAISQRFHQSPASRTTAQTVGLYGALAHGSLLGFATFGALLLLGDAVAPGISGLGLIACAVLVPFTLSRTWSQRLLFLDGRPLVAGLVSLVGTTLGLGGMIVLAAIDSLTPLTAVTVSIGAAVVEFGLCLLVIRPKLESPERSKVAELLKGGLRFHTGQIALFLLIRADVVILASLAGLADVGIYAVAVSITTPLSVLATTLTSTFLRSQFRSSDSGSIQATITLVRLNVTVLAPLLVILGLSSYWLVPLVWGDPFGDAVTALWILLPGVFAASLQRPLGNHFVRLGWHRMLNLRATVALATNILVCVLLIPQLGASGAAVASTVAYSIYALITIVTFCSRCNVSPASLLKPTLGFGTEKGALNEWST